MMKLKDSRQVKFHENHFDKKVFDTINCPEYLKKHLNLLKLSLFSKRYKFVFYCRKIKLFRANAKISSVENWSYFFILCLQFLQPYIYI